MKKIEKWDAGERGFSGLKRIIYFIKSASGKNLIKIVFKNLRQSAKIRVHPRPILLPANRETKKITNNVKVIAAEIKQNWQNAPMTNHCK